MINLPEDRRAPLTPQLALRVAVVGSLALAIFAVIFFRLWFLQVLTGDKYAQAAQTNRVRDIAIPAQRGQIVDSSGNVLVDSHPTIAVQISPPDLPREAAHRQALFERLAFVLGESSSPSRCVVAGHRDALRLAAIPCKVAQQLAILPYANVTLKTDVSPPVLDYLAERQTQFPGVEVEQVWQRTYPLGDLAAQLFGTVGPISPQELHDRHFRGASRQAIVGQSGIEYTYDQYLRGVDGAQRVQVDALGHPRGDLHETKPIAGHTLRLSLDMGLQKAGQAALAQAIANNPPAPAGAFVALDPRNGAVLAMGSSPSFDPNVLTHPITQRRYDQLFGPGSGNPLVNRAIAGAYPTGSTFKAITATAALQSGAWSLGEFYDDTGSFQEGTLIRHNAGNAAYGSVDIVHAIQVSSDTFFYNLGALMNSSAPQGGALQKWASAFGIGRPTGIDIGGESNPAGILPSPAWRARRNALELAYEHKHHTSCCTLADGRPWSVGDNVNTAVGQGDVEATPLQLAVAYSAVENGGTVVRPHVGLDVQSPDATVLQRIDPTPARRLAIASQNLDAIRSGLHLAASQPGGTSADVFSGWDQSRFPVYGKTGTAQHNGQADQSWYVCFVPDPQRPILVAVTVEQGGFGAMAAAPAAREILSQWFYGKRGQFMVGTSKTL